MERGNNVRIEHEKKNPPAAAGGLSKSKTGNAKTGCDLASALLAAIQARFRIRAAIDAERRILARRARGEAEILPDERGEHIAIHREGFDVLKASWPPVVRHGFAGLFGVEFEQFEDALEVLAEALLETSPASLEFSAMITPATFEAEAGR